MEYSFPLRLYFDIDNYSLSTPSFPDVVKTIYAAPFLSNHFTFLDDSALQSEILFKPAENFIGKSVAATVSAEYLDSFNISPLLSILYIASDSVSDTVKAFSSVSSSPAVKTGASIDMSITDPADLRDILSCLYEAGIRYIHIPIERYVTKRECALHNKSSLEKLAASLYSNPLPRDFNLQIHDPVLSRILKPDISISSGCQAANTMLYMTPSFELYPCPLIDMRLGKIDEISLQCRDFDDKRVYARRTLTSLSQFCLECTGKDNCNGGCRGRGMIHGGTSMADPLCDFLR